MLVAFAVVGLHLREPRVDLADPEPELTADPEAPGTTALAAEVVDGLDADPELRGELRHRDDRVEPVRRRCGIGGLALVCGLHAPQVRPSCRAGPRRVQTRRELRPDLLHGEVTSGLWW